MLAPIAFVLAGIALLAIGFAAAASRAPSLSLVVSVMAVVCALEALGRLLARRGV